MRTKQETAELRQANLLRAEAQLGRWELRLEALRAQIQRQGSSAEPLVQDEYRRQVEALAAKHSAISKRFNAFKDTSAERWATFQAAVLQDWNELAHDMKALGQAGGHP